MIYPRIFSSKDSVFIPIIGVDFAVPPKEKFLIAPKILKSLQVTQKSFVFIIQARRRRVPKTLNAGARLKMKWLRKGLVKINSQRENRRFQSVNQSEGHRTERKL